MLINSNRSKTQKGLLITQFRSVDNTVIKKTVAWTNALKSVINTFYKVAAKGHCCCSQSAVSKQRRLSERKK